MATYSGIVKTNHFKIKSREAFDEAVSLLSGGSPIQTKITEKDGVLYGWIGSYSEVDCYESDFESGTDMDIFFKKIQSDVITEDDAMFFTEVGNENLNYLVGYCTIVTVKDIRNVDLGYTSIDIARKMLNNPKWETKNSY